MVRIQSEIKRGFLRSLWREGKAAAATLAETLNGFQDAQFSQIRTGQILISTSGGGYSTSLRIPNLSDQITNEQFTALAEEYQTIYGDVVTQIGGSPTDDTIFAAMIADDRLQGVRSFMGDYTGLHFPAVSYR